MVLPSDDDLDDKPRLIRELLSSSGTKCDIQDYCNWSGQEGRKQKGEVIVVKQYQVNCSIRGLYGTES